MQEIGHEIKSRKWMVTKIDGGQHFFDFVSSLFMRLSTLVG